MNSLDDSFPEFKFIGGIKYLTAVKAALIAMSKSDNTVYGTPYKIDRKPVSKKGDMKDYTYPQGVIKALNQKLANKQAKKKGWIDRY